MGRRRTTMFKSSMSKKDTKFLMSMLGCMGSLIALPFVAIWSFIRGAMGKPAKPKKRRRHG